LPGLTVKADTLASCDRPKIGALHVVIKAPGSNLPTQSDQLSRDVVLFRQREQRRRLLMDLLMRTWLYRSQITLQYHSNSPASTKGVKFHSPNRHRWLVSPTAVSVRKNNCDLLISSDREIPFSNR
jgi:hypothetical protein